MKRKNKKKTFKLIGTVKKATAFAESSVWQADSEKGAALVTTLLILLLLMGFAAFAISRVTTETVITGNDSSESRAYAAATGGLDLATQAIASKLNSSITSPPLAEIKAIAERGVKESGALPDNYTVTTDVSPHGIASCQPLELGTGPHKGLIALRDAYRLDVTARDTRTEAEVQLMRTFYNDRIPLFQFGQFSEYNIVLQPGTTLHIGGRVHTNQNMFVGARTGVYFTDVVTTVGELTNTHSPLTQVGNAMVDKVYFKQPTVNMATYLNNPVTNSIELKTGEASTVCGNNMSPDVFASNSEIQVKCKQRAEWIDDKRTGSNGKGQAKFKGELQTYVSKLKMPLFQLAGQAIEIIKRGKNVGDKVNVNGSVVDVTKASQDDISLSSERFANKPGIRVSLSDSKQRLPGCAGSTNGNNDCGVRLDGDLNRSDGTKASVGYTPKSMKDGYQATALNATRFAYPNYSMPSSENPGLWIKVETVDGNGNTSDITEDFLSLGVTEPAPSSLNIEDYNHTANGTDSRSIIKLQRFSIPGVEIEEGDKNLLTYDSIGKQNYVMRYKNENGVTISPYTDPNTRVKKLGSCKNCSRGENLWRRGSLLSSSIEEDNWHLKWAKGRIGGYIVPFPIKLFDTRESTGFGIFDKSLLGTNAGKQSRIDMLNHYNSGKTLHSRGVMSLVDIDVSNLGQFFNGDFDNYFPNGLKASDIPSDRGWILYISDRRGDKDFDGQYDYSEDLSSREGPREDTSLDDKYLGRIGRSEAAVSDHRYYRRGVRLINAGTLPGGYNSSTTPCVKGVNDTLGFTVASENIVYVQGNYNTTSANINVSKPTISSEYNPLDDQNHIPAAIVADAVTVLSNSWQDSESFRDPYYLMPTQQSNRFPGRNTNPGRTASNTQYRFAMISGTPKRILENWGGSNRLNYSGSLIQVFKSQHSQPSEYTAYDVRLVYHPPKRDWAFEESFNTLTRLPPGTPFVSSVSLTGFQRVNE